VAFDNTRKKFIEIVSDLSVAQRTDIPIPLKSNPIIVKTDLAVSNIREMQGLRSKLLEVSRRARKDGKWNKARIADDVADAILEDIGIVAQTATTPEAADLQAALAATKHFKTRFESGITGKILGYDKSGAPAIDPSLTLDVSIGRSGQRGAVDIKKIVVTPEAKKATERYLARSYTEHALNKTGTIDPIKSERWVKSNEAILDQFPELRGQFLDAEGAQRLAQRTQEVMTARKAALRDKSVSISAKYLQSSDLHMEISTIFKNPNGARMTAELVRQARKDGTGQALSGLKHGFVEELLEKASIGAYNEFGEKSLSGRTLLGLINGHEATLSQAFTPDEISKMRQIGRELAKAETFMKAGIGKPDLDMKDWASRTLSLFARIQGARIGGKMGKESAGGSLQMAQIFSGKARDFVAWLTRDRAQEMIKDAVLSKDPALLRALLTPMAKPGTVSAKQLNNRLNVWLAGTGSRVYEDIQRDLQQEQ
jgi:hypothetical protein